MTFEMTRIGTQGCFCRKISRNRGTLSLIALTDKLFASLSIIIIGRVFDSAAKERGTGEMTEEEIAAFKEKYKKRVNNSAKISYLMRLPLLGAAALCVFLIPAVFNAIAFVAALIAEHILVLLSGVIIKGRV